MLPDNTNRFIKLSLLMKFLRYIPFPFLLLVAFCPVFSQKVAEYRWGEPSWNNLDRVWELPGGQLAATGSYLKSQNTLTEWKLMHLSTDGNVKAEFGLPARPQNVVPLGDGTTFFFEDRNQIRMARYRADALTGKLLDSIALPMPPSGNVFGTASAAHPDGGWVVMYSTREDLSGLLRIVRFDPEGKVVFDKSVKTSFTALVQQSQLLVLPSGRICLAHENFDGADELMIFNPAGFLLWKRLLPVQGVSFGTHQIIHLGSDRVAFVGNQSGTGQAYAAAFAAGGAGLWERKSFEAEVAGFGFSGAFHDNGSLVISGEYSALPSGLGMAVVKIAADGNLVFAQKYLLFGNNPMVSGLLSNGNYFFAGYRWTPIPGGFQGDKGYFLSLSPDGSTRWLLENDFIRPVIYDFCEMKDRGIALVGSTMSSTTPPVRQNALFYLSPTVPTASPATPESYIEAFPNPSADGQVGLRSRAEGQVIRWVQVFAADGREVARHWPDAAQLDVQLPAERGIYWLRAQMADGSSQLLPVSRQ
jgi:hypothetical protein